MICRNLKSEVEIRSYKIDPYLHARTHTRHTHTHLLTWRSYFLFLSQDFLYMMIFLQVFVLQ